MTSLLKTIETLSIVYYIKTLFGVLICLLSGFEIHFCVLLGMIEFLFVIEESIL